MSKYIALLRGVNVGGKAILKMADLRLALEKVGLENVQTYIQSGNVLFESSITNTSTLAQLVGTSIKKHFGIEVAVAVFSKQQWQNIIANAPAWWGKDKLWKHNLLILLEAYDMKDVVAAIGTLKTDIEAVEEGDGVLYQSMSLKLFGRTTTGKLASNPIYKKMTIRNFNTANKLLTLLDD